MGFLDKELLSEFPTNLKLYSKTLHSLTESNIDLALYYSMQAVLNQINCSLPTHCFSYSNLLTCHLSNESDISLLPFYLNLEMPIGFTKANSIYTIKQWSHIELLKAKPQKLLAFNSLKFNQLPITANISLDELNQSQMSHYQAFALYSLLSMIQSSLEISLNHLIKYCDERQQGGKKLNQWSLVKNNLDELSTSTELMKIKLNSLDTLNINILNPIFKSHAKIAKNSISKIMNLMGGYGYMREYPIEKQFRSIYFLSTLGNQHEL